MSDGVDEFPLVEPEIETVVEDVHPILTLEQEVLDWYRKEVKEVEIDISKIHPLAHVENCLSSLIERLKSR